jgi:hypothetical protein
MTIQIKSWKTTACGLTLALAGFVLFSPETFQHWPWAISLAKYVTLGGFAALGLTSKDSTEHSTQSEVARATVDQASASRAQAEVLILHAGGK